MSQRLKTAVYVLALVLCCTAIPIILFGPSFEPWIIMILPPGGFLTLGLMLAAFAHIVELRTRRAETSTERRAA